MPDYRIYAVGSDGRLMAVEDLDCADDQEAIKKATQAAKGSGSELRESERPTAPCSEPQMEFAHSRLRRPLALSVAHTTLQSCRCRGGGCSSAQLENLSPI